MTLPKVITIDGPSGTGKGTVARMLAKKLGWHYLDSGVIYRLLAFLAVQRKVDLSDISALKHLAENLISEFCDFHIYLAGQDVSNIIRTEQYGSIASKISAFPEVRNALLNKQRELRKSPGLVTDGRDMGTVVFPDAILKFFLQASPEIRASRRFGQLKQQGIHVSLPELVEELAARDARDRERVASPLRPAKDAIIVDTSELSVEEVLMQILAATARVLAI